MTDTTATTSGGKSHTVRNRTAAQQQITAEQILRESHQFIDDQPNELPIQYIQSKAELDQYKLDKRTYYENRLKLQQQGNATGTYIKYAEFEAKLYEFNRARSIYERGISYDYTNVSIWLHYAKFEAKNKFINHARNIYDRAVTLLPLQNKLWQNYTLFEELLDNIDGCILIYERWLTFKPNIQYIQQYIEFLTRHKRYNNVRQLYERLTIDEKYHSIELYIKWAKFENNYFNANDARAIYERGLHELQHDDSISYNYLYSFIQFEILQQEYERVHTMYKYALNNCKTDDKKRFLSSYTQFIKQYCNINEMNNIMLYNIIYEYDELLQENPYDYDVYYDYLTMLINENYDNNKIIQLFDQAIQYKPPIHTKQHYKRYIYFYIYYSYYVEVKLKDIQKAKQILCNAIEQCSQYNIYFVKLYILLAKLELRNNYNINATRKVLGQAIGLCNNKIKIFNYYIELELSLGNIERCRILYEKQISLYSNNIDIWLKYITFEYNLQEYQRVQKLYDMAIQHCIVNNDNNNDTTTTTLNQQSVQLLQSYIQYSIEQQQYDNIRNTYNIWLDKVNNNYDIVKQYIDFENNVVHNIDNVRKLYQQYDLYYKQHKYNEQRYMLINDWIVYEQQYNNDNAQLIQSLQSKQGTIVKRRHELYDDNNNVTGYEEYIDYIFNDDDDNKQQRNNNKQNKTLSLLQKAKLWKKQQQATQQQDNTMLHNDTHNTDSNNNQQQFDNHNDVNQQQQDINNNNNNTIDNVNEETIDID